MVPELGGWEWVGWVAASCVYEFGALSIGNGAAPATRTGADCLARPLTWSVDASLAGHALQAVAWTTCVSMLSTELCRLRQAGWSRTSRAKTTTHQPHVYRTANRVS
jgi:hypothetical protein